MKIISTQGRVNHFGMKPSQIIDIVMGNTFLKSFAQLGGLGPKSMSFFVYQSTMINQKLTFKNLWYFTLLKVRNETIKIIKYNQLKINKPYFRPFYQNRERA